MRKQAGDNAAFVRLRRDATAVVTLPEMERKVEAAAAEIRSVWAGKRVWFGWSGGKDSVALAEVCRRAGVTHSVFAMTRLEYPAFLAWVTANMPEDLEVYQTGLDLDWLARNPRMLFPQDAATAAKWFQQVQHKAQDFAVNRYTLDGLVLGRRRQDGNFVGRNGANIYEKGGVTRHSPLADWTHADVLACCGHYNLPLPPIYDWPNGFVVGTGSWAARQYTKTVANGWREVYANDPSVVHAAASRIASARAFLAAAGV